MLIILISCSNKGRVSVINDRSLDEFLYIINKTKLTMITNQWNGLNLINYLDGKTGYISYESYITEEINSISYGHLVYQGLGLGNSKKINYLRFKNIGLYDKEIIRNYKEIKKSIKEISFSREISYLENLFNYRFNEYIIVPSLFIPSTWGFGKVHNETAYYILGPTNIYKKNMSLRNFDFGNSQELKKLAVHEFGHSFYRKSIYNDPELISKYEYLLTDLLLDKMNRQGYNDWNTIFEEHFVRAIELLYLTETNRNYDVNTYLRELENKGYLYIEIFYEIILDISIEELFTSTSSKSTFFKNIEEAVGVFNNY